MDGHGARVAGECVVPDVVHELITAKDLPAIVGEEEEKVEQSVATSMSLDGGVGGTVY